jgi:hypothetical protein
MSWLDNLFIDSESREAANQADRQLDALNRKRMEDQKISQDEYERRREQLTNWAFPEVDLGGGPGRLLEQPGVSPAEGFREGLGDGVESRQAEGRVLSGRGRGGNQVHKWIGRGGRSSAKQRRGRPVEGSWRRSSSSIQAHVILSSPGPARAGRPGQGPRK